MLVLYSILNIVPLRIDLTWDTEIGRQQNVTPAQLEYSIGLGK